MQCLAKVALAIGLRSEATWRYLEPPCYSWIGDPRRASDVKVYGPAHGRLTVRVMMRCWCCDGTDGNAAWICTATVQELLPQVSKCHCAAPIPASDVTANVSSHTQSELKKRC